LNPDNLALFLLVFVPMPLAAPGITCPFERPCLWFYSALYQACRWALWALARGVQLGSNVVNMEASLWACWCPIHWTMRVQREWYG